MSESGTFYATFIDPILKSMRKHVVNEIDPNSSVIDIACGTGAQVFEIAKIANRVVGIDLSESMIKYATKMNISQKLNNTEFFVADATDLSLFSDNEFDIATMSLALHQFSPEFYTPILRELKRAAKKVIIVDYSVPLPKSAAGYASKIIEFIAGKTHHKNFRNYYKIGGLNEIIISNQLSIEKSKWFGGGTFQLVVCTPA
ncbi:class I SAM-dependent methyltransferase [Draconibacterium sp.]|nr:class I SAM-dependent methyltransferase [Draconibacterium sp.]